MVVSRQTNWQLIAIVCQSIDMARFICQGNNVINTIVRQLNLFRANVSMNFSWKWCSLNWTYLLIPYEIVLSCDFISTLSCLLVCVIEILNFSVNISDMREPVPPIMNDKLVQLTVRIDDVLVLPCVAYASPRPTYR